MQHSCLSDGSYFKAQERLRSGTFTIKLFSELRVVPSHQTAFAVVVMLTPERVPVL